MPKDYSLDVTPPNAQRRPEHARDDEWARTFIGRARVGHVATHWEEQPFITPTMFWYDQERHEIVFHSNVVGRVRGNSDSYREVCFEASEFGRLLPANIALEFSIQYESVIAFGAIRVLDDVEEKRRALYGMLGKYFPTMRAGEHYRPITDKELKRTSVYALTITSWSGKRNWAERAAQSDEWPPLGPEWFEPEGA
jgi:nitroimidazol reductase NimA-like FMN-containing flavoprotein (pyridoxamine 5'-phosphate oxidase superfamily)